MKLRYWLLLIGALLVVAGHTGSDLAWWRYAFLVIGGSGIGVWAHEGMREDLRDRGIDMEPW